jgi:hypothetical protein
MDQPQEPVEWPGWPPIGEVEMGSACAYETRDTPLVIKARCILAERRGLDPWKESSASG